MSSLVEVCFGRVSLSCYWPDAQVILDCPLRKDIVYTIAMPTFHHWKVEDRRCGLSFQCPADGRAFDRGVRKAIEDLAEGMLCYNVEVITVSVEEQLKIHQTIRLINGTRQLVGNRNLIIGCLSSTRSH